MRTAVNRALQSGLIVAATLPIAAFFLSWGKIHGGDSGPWGQLQYTLDPRGKDIGVMGYLTLSFGLVLLSLGAMALKPQWFQSLTRSCAVISPVGAIFLLLTPLRRGVLFVEYWIYEVKHWEYYLSEGFFHPFGVFFRNLPGPVLALSGFMLVLTCAMLLLISTRSKEQTVDAKSP
jgi:hypothetical protein